MMEEKEPTQKEWKGILGEQTKAYQEDLVKYTNEIESLKKIVIKRNKEITKLKGILEKRIVSEGMGYIGKCSNCGSDKAIFEVGDIKECLVCYMESREKAIEQSKEQSNKKLSQIEKENKLGDWLRKNHPKIWEKWLDTLPSATDLRKEFHKAGIKKI